MALEIIVGVPAPVVAEKYGVSEDTVSDATAWFKENRSLSTGDPVVDKGSMREILATIKEDLAFISAETDDDQVKVDAIWLRVKVIEREAKLELGMR